MKDFYLDGLAMSEVDEATDHNVWWLSLELLTLQPSWIWAVLKE